MRRAFYGLLGLVGELMITLGVLLGLFVVWQLWWTDVVAERYQEELVASLDWPEPPAATAEPEQRRDEPPVLEEPGTGDLFALLYVPRWDGNPPVSLAQGVDKPSILDKGFGGHFPGTAMPGGVGNFSVAGHRTTYGKPFNRIAELEPGDPLVVRTEEVWYVYRVTESLIVLPTQVEVIAPVPGQPELPASGRYLTLAACHPMFSAKERYIVHAELDYWMPVASGTPAEVLAMAGVS